MILSLFNDIKSVLRCLTKYYKGKLANHSTRTNTIFNLERERKMKNNRIKYCDIGKENTMKFNFYR